MTSLDILKVARSVATEVRRVLDDPVLLNDYSGLIGVKGEDNETLRIDTFAESLILANLRESKFDGKLFSEEMGLVDFGPSEGMVVTDPYCNTSLTFRGIRESAITLYYFDANDSLIAGAIVDLQIDRILYFDGGQCRVFHYATSDNPGAEAHVSGVARIQDAFVVASLLKQKRRNDLDADFLRLPKFLSTVDGGIVGLRLALGEVDAFVDHRVGQPAYEALSYIFASILGASVVDPATGLSIDFAKIVRGLRSNDCSRQRILAASTDLLSTEIQSHLRL